MKIGCKDTTYPVIILGTISSPALYFYSNRFRVIVAGGGTGSVTMYYSEQLNASNSEILYLDFSSSSMNIAQRRARIRKLKNVIWIQTWLEALTYLGAGFFEQAQCSGVLHHLKNPILGLKILKGSLTKDGGMNLMVYALYGRIAVYQLQHLLKVMKDDNLGIERELEITNHTLNVLPTHQWFVANPLMNDHKGGNMGIYDLLLHKRDVAFSMKSLSQWLIEGGLYFVNFDFFKNRFNYDIRYILSDELLIQRVSLKTKSNQWAISEIIRSSIIKHEFYASKDRNSEASLSDPMNRIYVHGNPRGFRYALSNPKNRQTIRGKKMFLAKLSGTYLTPSKIHFKQLKSSPSQYDVTFGWEINHYNTFMMLQLLESVHGISLKRIHQQYKRNTNSSLNYQQLFRLFEDFYFSIKNTGMILIRKYYVNLFPKTASVSLFDIDSM